MILALLISRLDVGFVFFKMGCSGLLSSETTWVGSCFFGCSRVETRDMWMLPRDVTEKRSYRLQALSSLFFDVMPSILRIRLDGWFSRCRGQSSGKSASRQRASPERGSTRKVTSAVQEMFKRVKPCFRERFATGALF